MIKLRVVLSLYAFNTNLQREYRRKKIFCVSFFFLYFSSLSSLFSLLFFIFFELRSAFYFTNRTVERLLYIWFCVCLSLWAMKAKSLNWERGWCEREAIGWVPLVVERDICVSVWACVLRSEFNYYCFLFKIFFGKFSNFPGKFLNFGPFDRLSHVILSFLIWQQCKNSISMHVCVSRERRENVNNFCRQHYVDGGIRWRWIWKGEEREKWERYECLKIAVWGFEMC